MKKKALIIGHSGQDGFYLRTHLQSLSYEVYGVSSSSVFASDGTSIPEGKIESSEYVKQLLLHVQPDEIYFLAALHQSSIEQNHSDLSFYEATIQTNAMAWLYVLEAAWQNHANARLFFASSSHVFGATTAKIQNELTPYAPVSIYGISKVLGMQFSEMYRKKGLACYSGIFYNHESPLRAAKFVSKKIVQTAVAIKLGKANELVLGDLSAQIDWGYAPDYVQAAHKLLQSDQPGDYIISSGKLHTVRNFVDLVFNALSLNPDEYVKVNQDLIQKISTTVLQGDHQQLKSVTGWEPSVSFEAMVNLLVEAELNAQAQSLNL